jgi:hypothetical protein
MTDSEKPVESTPTVSPFWVKAKILLGFVPIIAALGTAITSLLKAYDTTGPKATYDVLSKKVEANAAALQDVHADVKVVWAYINGERVGKAQIAASPPPVTSDKTPPKPPPPTPAAYYTKKPPKNEPLPIEGVVGPEAMSEAKAEPVPEIVKGGVLPEMSPPPSTEKLPTYEQVVQDATNPTSKKKN